MKTRKHLEFGLVFVLPAVMVTLVGMVRQADGALIASWDFHEGSGNSAAANEVGIGDAVFESFGSGSQPTWVSGAPVPGAADNSAIHVVRPNPDIYDGGYAAVSTDNVFNFPVEGSFSVAVWLKMPKPTGTTGLVNTLGTSSITGWGLVAFSDGRVQLEMKPTGGSARAISVGATSYMDNTNWFHLAATYQGGNTSGNSTAALTLYLNGQQVATNTVDFGGDYSGAKFPDHDLHFGAYANLTRGLQGSLDGVRIYDHVLGVGEVRELVPSLWNGGAGNWHDVTKWSTSWVPGSGNTATIGTGGTPTILDTRDVGHVTVAGGASLRLQGGITVTGDSLTLVGGTGATRGELRNVSGNNEWIGPIAVQPGQVIVHAEGGTSLTLSGPVALANTTHGKLLAVGNGNVAITGNISGGANAGDEAVATSSGFHGTLSLGGTNTYVGHTRINNGILSVAGGSAIPDTSRVWLFNNGRLDLQANETVGSLESADTTTQVTLNANTLTVGADGTSRSYAGSISGEGGSLTKIGSGIQTLSGVNTYTGPTQIDNGVISVAGGSAIPDASRVSLANDGTLNLQANETIGSLDSAATTTRVTLNANTLTVGGDNSNQSFAGVISGTGGLAKIGSGTQILTGGNTYDGTTTVSAGVLRIENNMALGTTAGGTTVASGASLQLSGGITVTGESLSLTGGGGPGNPGALRNLSGNNEWAGSITMLAGQTNYVGSGSGILTLSGPVTFSGSQTAGFFVANGSGNIAVSGNIAGGTSGGESVATSGGFSGTLTLSGTNTYAGHTRINAGTISVAGGSAIPDASRVWLLNNGSFNLQANETIGSLHSDAPTTQVTLNANTLTVGGDGTDRSFAGAITGTGGVTKIGAGVQTLKGGGIAYQGNTAVSGGRLVFEDATSFGNNQAGPTAMTLSNDSTLEFKLGTGNHQNVGLASQVAIGGNGSLVKSGAGTLVLGGQHSYSGDTILEGGTLTLQGGVRVGGSELWLDASDSASLTLNGGNTVEQWADRSGNDRHAVAAGSTQPLATTNPLVGDLGVVRFDGTNQILNVDLSFLAGSEYTIFAVEGRTSSRTTNYFLGTPTAALNKGLHVGYMDNTTYRLAQHANDLDHPVPAYTSQEFRVWTNVLDFAYGHAIHLNGADPVTNSDKRALITADNGRIGAGQRPENVQWFHGDLGELILFDRALSPAERQAVEAYLLRKWLLGLPTTNVLPADTHLRIAAGATLDLGGIDQTVGSLADHGGGGGTVINSGISAVNLNVAGTATTEFSGTLADGAAGDSLGLTHSGSGTLTLSGNNTYTGATTVLGGTLAVNGSLSGTSGVTLGPGATLGGSGAIAAAVTGAGLVSPGNSAGILTVSAIDPSDGMDFVFEFGRQGSPDYANAAASINDVLRLTDLAGPFASDLAAGNTIDVYLGVEDLAWGRKFRGGLYTDRDQDFLSSIEDAAFNYYILGDGNGGYEFNGQAYYSMTESWPTWSFELATVPEFAAFAGGTAGGYVMQLTAVPEPGSLAMFACGLLGLLAFYGRRRRR